MDIFISEYVEGSSNNKALELYNPTNSAIDLDAGNYEIAIYFNGNTIPHNTVDLTGIIAPGETFVIADDDANTTITAVADRTNAGSFFNGNDTILLRKNGANIDVIGRLYFDPGSQFGSGNTSTQDNTIRRKSHIISGDTNPDDVFDPSLEWEGFANDTFDGLGSHDIAPRLSNFTPADEAIAVAIDADFSIQFDENIQVWTGDIVIKNSDDNSIFETIDITSDRISISGDTVTIDPDSDLDPSTSYYIQIDGSAIADTAGNNYAGIDDNTTWNFTTQAITKIHDIQGDGASSPLAGQTVTVEAIVVGDFQTGLTGFYLQEEDADIDGDETTSEGIFVYNDSFDVNVGDKVRLTGTVDEFFDLTEINNITDVTVISSGNTLPTATNVSLPATAVATNSDGEYMPI